MKSRFIERLGRDVSIFSFCTASLHHLNSLKQQISLLECAVEHGFTHFDTAPLYGFGLAESVIGRSGLRGKPDITVATKVGLLPPGGVRQGRLSSTLRKVAGRLVKSVSRPIVCWSVSGAENSLNESLRKLRRESVDILWLHEPRIDLIETDEWLKFLEQIALRKLPAWGLQGSANP